MKKVIIMFVLMAPLIGFSQKLKRVENEGQVTIMLNNLVVEIQYVDENGKLRSNNYGYAVIKFKHDKRNNVIEQSYYDANLKPALDELGVSIWKKKYDKRNNLIYQSHYGKDGKLLPANKNILYSKWYWKYDKKGNLISTKTKNKRL